jgi:cyclin-dependent kinase 10
MSPIVVTLWYRAPELLFGVKDYSNAIDLWSVGCIFAELLAHKPLFPAKSELALLELMIELLGTPHEGIWTGFDRLPMVHRFKLPQQPYSSIKDNFGYLSNEGIRFLSKLLLYDPNQRLSAGSASRHPYFRAPPLALTPELMPTFPHHRNRLGD